MGDIMPGIPAEYVPYVEEYAAKNWDVASHNNSLAQGWITQAEYDATIALIPLPIPIAPSVTSDDVNNMVIGINETMEYMIDDETVYTAFVIPSPIFTGEHTVKVRAKAVPGVSKASLDAILIFTTNPVKPSPPTVYMDDNEDFIVGINDTMEFSYDGIQYTRYSNGMTIGLSGNLIINVRICAEGINPCSDAIVLPFTYNPQTPLAPDVTLTGENTINGMTTYMEFSVDDSTYVLYNSIIFSMINFNGEHLFKARIKAKGDNPYSEDTILNLTTTLVPVKPTAPSITIDDELNTITGMANGMEFNFDDMGYVPYDEATFGEIDFSGDHILLVRIAAEGINPCSEDKILAFTL